MFPTFFPSSQHTNTVVVITTLSAALIALMPFKFILMSLILYGFVMTSKLGERFQSDQGNRRLQEWWDSIPIIPVEVVDKESDSSRVVGDDRQVQFPTILSIHKSIMLLN